MRSQKTALYIIFLFSGFSALVYETLWLRVLGRILGNTVYASSLVLAVFMAGLALGSFIIGKYADRSTSPLRFYAKLEAAVGLCALAVFFSFNHLTGIFQTLYHWAGGNRLALSFFQASVLFVLLLIPTSLLGGTLPLLSTMTRRLEASFHSIIGNLYGLNTLGAVAGVLGTGYLLIGDIGEFNTLITAVLINFLVAFCAMLLARTDLPDSEKSESRADEMPQISPYHDRVRTVVLWSYCISGFVAIAYEVVWTRLLQIHLQTSIYAFSTMLGIYLLGVASGSIVGGLMMKRIRDPLGFFGFAQALIALFSAADLYLFTLINQSGGDVLTYIIVVPIILIFPITFILGLIFPIVSQCYVSRRSDIGRDIGRLYSANTIGAIAGSLVCGFILIRFFGTRSTLLMLSFINMSIGIILIAVCNKYAARTRFSIPAYLCAAGLIVCAFLAPDPFLTAVKKVYGPSICYHKESIAATTTAIVVPGKPAESRLLVNGNGMTYLCTQTKVMAHLPVLLHGNARDALVICMGMGTTLRSLHLYQNIECHVVELVPEVYECFKYFHHDGDAILNDPRVHHYSDDGRNFLLMHDRKYDIITMDPPPPMCGSGTVNLISLDFYELCKKRLNKGGIMTLWVMPGMLTEVRMVMATFLKAFPHTTVWRSPDYTGFYLIGSQEPLSIDRSVFQKLQNSEIIRKDLTEWDRVLPDPESLIDLFVLDSREFAAFTEGSPIITDEFPYTEFPLWRALYEPINKRVFEAHNLCRWKILNASGNK